MVLTILVLYCTTKNCESIAELDGELTAIYLHDLSARYRPLRQLIEIDCL